MRRHWMTAYFKNSLDGFDRRFESRDLVLLEGPKQDGQSVWVRGRATYRAAGVPEFVLELEETAHFDEKRICRLVDHYEPEMKQQVFTYLSEYGAKLGMSADA